MRPIRNRFFGEQVTVAGLLTGQDLLDQLSGEDLGSALLLPEVMLKDAGTLFLDDLSLNDIEATLQLPVIKIASSPWGLLDGLEDLAGGAPEVIRCDQP
jgi:NifB/MoaA-like Fe-S oxidoreductase